MRPGKNSSCVMQRVVTRCRSLQRRAWAATMRALTAHTRYRRRLSSTNETRPIKVVERDLGVTIYTAALLVVMLVLAVFLFIHDVYTNRARDDAKAQLDAALQIYITNLLSRITVITSSTEFIDYIRSGVLSRSQQQTQFLGLMSRLPKDEIMGWTLTKSDNSVLYETGERSAHSISLPLCYLGDVLNAQHGTCVGTFKIFLSETAVLDELALINHNVVRCASCVPVTTLPVTKHEFLGANTDVALPITVRPDENTLLILSVGATSILGIILVAARVSTRVKSLVRRQIIQPIVGVSSGAQYDGAGESTITEIVEMCARRDLLKMKSYVEEEQKRSLANDLHDVLGSMLLMVRWDIARLEADHSHQVVKSALRRVDDAIQETSNIIESLRPEVLDTLGLSGALTTLVDEWAKKNITCSYDTTIATADTDVPDAVATGVYRIAQEALANIFKHSRATNTIVALSVETASTPAFLRLVIEDNGVGIETNRRATSSGPTPGGHGLTSMKERALSLGGSMVIERAVPSGTRISVSLPASPLTL